MASDGNGGSSPDDPDEDAVKNVMQRSEKTLDYQFDTLSDIDDKAIRIYRANILFLSIIIGGLSFAANNGFDFFNRVINLNSVFGMILLIGSLAAGAMTYRSSDVEGGITPDEIDRTFAEAHDKGESLSMVAEKYKDYIEENDEALERNAQLITYTTIITIDALAYIATGVFVTVLVTGTPPLTVAFLLSIVTLPVAIWISKILAYPDCSGRRFVTCSTMVLVVPVSYSIVQALLFHGDWETVWLLVPLYFAGVALFQRGLDLVEFRNYFVILSVLLLCSSFLYISPPVLGPGSRTVLQAVLPASIVDVLSSVNRIDISMFVLVGTVLLVVDDYIY